MTNPYQTILDARYNIITAERQILKDVKKALRNRLTPYLHSGNKLIVNDIKVHHFDGTTIEGIDFAILRASEQAAYTIGIVDLSKFYTGNGIIIYNEERVKELFL